MIFPLIADWLNNALAWIFLVAIDTICYGLLTVSYNIFYAVAQIDLFGGGSAGQVLYNEITKRLYMVLSIIMVFVFAYHLIMLVIDPDGKGRGAMSQIIKDTLLSIVLLIALPFVYRSMAMFQFHVLEDGTIPAIILGTNAQNSDQDPGKNVAMMVLVSFFHPNGTTYNTFFDENGYIRGDATEQCLADTAEADGEEHPDTCELFTAALTRWTEGSGWVTNITTGEKKLRHWIGDTMSYAWILSSFAAIAIAYVFLLYSIDIGTRAVKLGVLQLITPIPIILRIFPGTKKSFDTWFSHMKKTYLELFIRVAVIFFALELIKLVPTFIATIFQSQGSSVAGAFTKCVATVILILGLLKFAQDAVPLFKELFSVGGNLLSGVNLKANLNPKKGFTSRVTDNKAAMWGLGKGMNMVGGWKSQFGTEYNKNKAALINATDNELEASVKSAWYAARSGLRGVITGAKTKTNLTDLDSNSIRQAVVTGADAANKQYNESSLLQARSRNRVDYLEEKIDRETYKAANKAAKDAAKEERKDEKQYAREQYQSRVSGEYAASTASSQSLTAIVDGLSGVKEHTKDKTKAVTKKIEDLQAKLNTMPAPTDPGSFTEVPPVQGTMSMAEYQQRMQEYNENRKKYEESKAKYQEYTDLKNALAAAKDEKNDIIAKELSTAMGSKFAEATLDEVIDHIKKTPAGTLVDKDNKDISADILAQVESLRNIAKGGTLTGADIKELNGLIDDMKNAKTYSAAYSQIQQNQNSRFNASSGNSNGSGGSGGSGGSSGSGGSGGSSGSGS